MKRTGTLLSLMLMAFLAACGNKTYVELDGRKLTEADLKKEMPERLEKLKESVDRQYRTQVEQMLQELAHKRMIEKEAKERGVEVQAYMDAISQSAPPPTPEEVEAFYADLKHNGQLKGAGAGIKGDIERYLAQQNREGAVQAEIGRLKKKYGFKVPMERFEVSTVAEPNRGGTNAKVTIVEFTDFECPFCLRAQKTTKQLREKYGDRINVVFKDFPLDFHHSAMGAHIAANCVYREKPDAYWNFFDGIFDAGRPKETLQPDSLKNRAISLGLDPAKYDSCMNDPSVMKEIEDDIKEGGAIGVTGTPAFFINGRMLSGAQPADAFIEIIEEELAN